MSDLYIRRLGRIRDEYQAAAGALSYVTIHWHRHNIFSFSVLETVSIEDMRRAAEDLEVTFLIRLFSGFEGILKEHLSKDHPQVRVRDDVSVAWLIDRSSVLQRPRIVDPLRTRVHEVRRYRNYLVHPGGPMPAVILFSESLARLTRFVNRLPDPPY